MPRNSRFHWMLPAKAACPLWIPLPIGRSRPCWKPRAKGIAIPLESQLVLKGVPANEKWFVRIHFKTQKSHSQSSIHERKVCGILFACALTSTKYSCITHLYPGAGICNHIRFLTRQPSEAISGQFDIMQIFRASEYQIHGFSIAQITSDRLF